MYSEEIFNRIAVSGGFYSLKMFSERESNALRKYVRRHNLSDVVSTFQRQRAGFIYKVKDDILKNYYSPDARKGRRLFTTSGLKEFHKRVGEYIALNNLSNAFQSYSGKKWYNKIYNEMIEDSRYSRFTRFNISDYKLYVSFTRLIASLNYGIVIIPAVEEQEFLDEHGLTDKRQVSTGITFGYSYTRKRTVIVVSDFMKSENSIMQILMFYNSPEFEIFVISLRDAKQFEEKLRKKMALKFETVPPLKVVNHPFLNMFFGEL